MIPIFDEFFYVNLRMYDLCFSQVDSFGGKVYNIPHHVNIRECNTGASNYTLVHVTQLSGLLIIIVNILCEEHDKFSKL